MCGVAGIFNLDHSPIQVQSLSRMSKMLQHRGPDDEGFLLFNTKNDNFKSFAGNDSSEKVKSQHPLLDFSFSANLGFGFRRLSIVDLSEKGHQPMCTSDQQCWIQFNGEIYNYIEIRNELIAKGYRFVSNSDTEVILYAYREWGTDCLKKFNGMWAFALWDNRTKTLFCSRDRFGVKPFYYFFDGKQFVFASEIKAILAAGITDDINIQTIHRVMKVSTFMNGGKDTFFKSIHSLPNAYYILINNDFAIKQYYDLDPQAFEKNKIPYNQAIDEYRSLFQDSIRLRMRSDVEVGSSLSGGLDSSAIVCLAARQTPKKLKTISAFFEKPLWMDERKWIKLVTEDSKSDSYLISPTPADFLQDFEKITWHHDFPVIGSSPFTQYYVMKTARQQGVIVMLDGQGSDEIVCGYNHAFYRYYSDLIRQFNFRKLFREFPDYLRHHRKASTFQKLSRIGMAMIFTEPQLYDIEFKYFYPEIIENGNTNGLESFIKKKSTSKLSNFSYNLTMNFHIQTLLHFEDRNSMAWSVESREPFLDYRLVEFAFSLPSSYKIHGNFGKRIHRDAMKEFVPADIINRKDKVGFSAPGEHYWLKNELKPFFNDLIESTQFQQRGIYQVDKIRSLYKKFLNGRDDLGPLLWRVMALEVWFRVVKMNWHAKS